MPVNLETARAALLARKSEIEREQEAGEADRAPPHGGTVEDRRRVPAA
jgi:hypothetical protein